MGVAAEDPRLDQRQRVIARLQRGLNDFGRLDPDLNRDVRGAQRGLERGGRAAGY